jgi:hypothetical protein
MLGSVVALLPAVDETHEPESPGHIKAQAPRDGTGAPDEPTDAPQLLRDARVALAGAIASVALRGPG